MRKTLLLSIIFLTALTASSCARQIVLHPMTDADIRQDGKWICMTPEYIQEVMKARLGK